MMLFFFSFLSFFVLISFETFFLFYGKVKLLVGEEGFFFGKVKLLVEEQGFDSFFFLEDKIIR